MIFFFGSFLGQIELECYFFFSFEYVTEGCNVKKSAANLYILLAYVPFMYMSELRI